MTHHTLIFGQFGRAAMQQHNFWLHEGAQLFLHSNLIPVNLISLQEKNKLQ